MFFSISRHNTRSLFGRSMSLLVTSAEEYGIRSKISEAILNDRDGAQVRPDFPFGSLLLQLRSK